MARRRGKRKVVGVKERCGEEKRREGRRGEEEEIMEQGGERRRGRLK